MPPPVRALRLAICSAERLVRDALEALCLEHSLQVVATAATPSGCIAETRTSGVDILICDLRNNLDTLDYLRGVRDGGGPKILLICSNEVVPADFASVLSPAVDGLALIEAIRTLGLRKTDQPLRKRGRPDSHTGGLPLTPREFHVAQLIAQGRSNEAIATDLGVSETRVKQLAGIIARKLRCQNRVQVALLMSRHAAETLGTEDPAESDNSQVSGGEMCD